MSPNVTLSSTTLAVNNKAKRCLSCDPWPPQRRVPVPQFAGIELEAPRREVTYLWSHGKLVAELRSQGAPLSPSPENVLTTPTWEGVGCLGLSESTEDVTSSVPARPGLGLGSRKVGRWVGSYRTDPGGHNLPAPFNE